MRKTLFISFNICLVAALAVGAPTDGKTAPDPVAPKMESSHEAELEAARKDLVVALEVKAKADGELKEAETNLAWAKDNMRENLVSKYKKDVTEARHSVDVARKAIASAQKQVSKIENAISKAQAEAERKARAEAEAKAAEKKKARDEAERKARAEAEAKAAEEKKARDEAERIARAEAEAKAAEEKKARDEAERKARAEAEEKAEAERKARADEEAKAIEAEKALLELRGQELSAKYAAAYSTAVDAFNAASTKVLEANRALAAARAQYKKVRSDKRSSSVRIDAARAGIIFAENQLNSAEKDYDRARRAVSEAKEAISRIDRDVRKAYAEELRAQGRKPLTYSTGLFGF
jgi:chromosome segregation ATPase